jgi:hypothetical protein
MKIELTKHHHSWFFLRFTRRTLWTIAASKRIIAIPVVNQVVTGEITASRSGIRAGSPIALP